MPCLDARLDLPLQRRLPGGSFRIAAPSGRMHVITTPKRIIYVVLEQWCCMNQS
jgi:hypothetical protein